VQELALKKMIDHYHYVFKTSFPSLEYKLVVLLIYFRYFLDRKLPYFMVITILVKIIFVWKWSIDDRVRHALFVLKENPTNLSSYYKFRLIKFFSVWMEYSDIMFFAVFISGVIFGAIFGAISLSVFMNDGGLVIPEIIKNNLPEEQKRDLSELRKRWRSCNENNFKVETKTYYFWMKHLWCISWSEIGKYIKDFLPNRWI
jgi:hypothetical protein